ncbi:TonB-dependent receptor [Agriterribacter sp.]|uniref:SusC/RagA family TonB-linked outer membrane protein n=1 Tax=Agriterribacter sp. TaxID=2821509 RepID=UPI002BD7F798|nr:TonB-dependent receptor [Agriterribacter sp.]HRP54533.1 TonB-dependent receptor [Agriterribacter sp.]
MGMKYILSGLLSLFLWYGGLNPSAIRANPSDKEKITLLEAIEKISQKYDVYFTFDMTLVSKVEVQYEQALYSSAEDAISRILKGTGLKYQFYDRRFVILYKDDAKGLESLRQMSKHLNGLISEGEKKMDSTTKNNMLAVARLPTQSILKTIPRVAFSVEGTVTNQEGEPLIGVTVQVKGTGKATTTNTGGHFTLNDIEANAVLVLSYVGFETQEVKVAGKTNLKIVMLSSTQALGEVVVVGYGTQKKEDLTGALKTIDQKSIKDLPVSAVDQKLVGRVAGVEIQQVSGAPGAGTSVKIRGSGSLGAGNEPLYVIDGMPYSSGLNQEINPLSFINPDDIQDVTILKDASSTAIYGSRGANGVIMITTKNASKDQSLINYSGYTGFSSIPEKGRPKMLNAKEFAEYQRDRIDYVVRQREGRDAVLSDYPEEYQDLDKLGEGTNWYNLLLRNAFTQNHNISIQRGAKNSQLYLSAGYFDQEGTIRNTNLKRYSANFNYNLNINSFIKLGASLMPTFIDQTRASTGTGRDLDPTGISLWANPVMKPFDEDGNLVPYILTPKNSYNSTWNFPNPLFMLDEAPRKYNEIRNLGSAFVEIEPIKGLQIRSSINTTFSVFKNSRYVPSTIGSPNNPPTNNKGTLNLSEGNSFDWVITNTATYSKKLEKHSFKGLVGYITQKSRYNSINLNASPYSNDLIKTLNAADGITSWGQTINEWNMLSYLGRINYAFMDRYLLTATIRSDGSSRFGENKRYAMFPSVAAAWRVSDEDFIKDIQWIDQLKVRASFGKSGNNNIGNYSHLSNVSLGRYVLNDNIVSAASVSLFNPDLGWEESEQIDLGMDLVILDGRIGITGDLYRRKSVNMLLNNVIPAITGFNSQLVNMGSVLNKGLELELDVTPIRSNNWNWTWNFNIAFNKNKVLSTNENGDNILAGSMDGRATNVSIVGKPIGEFYGFILEGVYSQADIDNPAVPKYPGNTAGYPKYKDLNGDGVITEILDYTNLGSPNPDFTFGFSSRLSYKNIDISASLNGRQGGYVMNGLRQTIDNLQGFFNLGKEWLNRYRSDKDPGDGIHAFGPNAVHRVNDKLWLESASYLRITNLNIGYTFQTRFERRNVLFKNFRVYVSVQNLATFTKYTGQNPEGQGINVNNTLAPGYDMNSYPVARTVTAGINITF